MFGLISQMHCTFSQFIVLNLVRPFIVFKNIAPLDSEAEKNAQSNIHYAYYNVKNSTNVNFESKSDQI